jgi:sulfatase modifying factor 1
MQMIEAGAVTIADRRTKRSWTVEIAPFLLSPLQVTRRAMAATYGFAIAGAEDGDDLLPATSTSWFDAVRFCNRLSEQEGLRPAYAITGEEPAIEAGEAEAGGAPGAGSAEIGRVPGASSSELGTAEAGGSTASSAELGWSRAGAGSGSEAVAWDRTADGYRLPTEAEWEYACRAGTTGPRYGELDEIAWYRGNSGERLHRGGELAANAWGLYDMLGNAWEWCFDVYDAEVYRDYRVIKGGGWFDEHWSCRAGVRRRTMPTLRIDDLGFRLARNVSR